MQIEVEPVCRKFGCECADETPCCRRAGGLDWVEKRTVGGDWVLVHASELEPMIASDIAERIGGGAAICDGYVGLDGETYRWE